MNRADALLRDALRALNSQPRFTFGDGDSYRLAAAIEEYLRCSVMGPAPRGCAAGGTGYIGKTE